MAVSYQHDFGAWLRHARMALDLTQETLAEAVGCATQTVRSFESGRRRPSREMAARLADILQVPLVERDAFLRLARAPLATAQTRSDTVDRADTGSLVASLLYAPDTAGEAQHQPTRSVDDGVQGPAQPLILATKFYIPRPRVDLVRRPRLFTRLDAAISVPLTIVAAPAGFGKTTIISAWLRERMSDQGAKGRDDVAETLRYPSTF